MVKAKTMMIALLAVILAVIAWVHLSQSDAKRIKRQFDSLSKLVSKEPGENPITMVTKARTLGALFADTCKLTLSLDGQTKIYTPAEISSYAANTRIAFSELSLKFYDFNIEFPETGTARVTLTADLRGKLMSGDAVDETREVQCVLTKIDRKWLFSEIEDIEVLKR